MKLPLLTLASASPRRTELLTQASIDHRIHPVEVDEESIVSPDGPAASALLRAKAKARAATAVDGSILILAADTRVVANGRALDKASDRSDARQMIELLSGTWHSVFTGIVVQQSTAPHTQHSELVETRVRFTALSAAEIEWYLDSDEWRGVAGSYRIQGLAARFIPEIQGSYSNVVGLPISTVYSMVSRFL